MRRDGHGPLLELVGDLIGVLDVEELRPALLESILRCIPAKWASLNEVGPDGVTSLVHPHLDEVWFDRFAELAQENAIYQHWVRTRDGRATRFSDVISREELHTSRIYRELYGPLGIEHQMVISLPNGPDQVLALVLSRGEPDFSDEERDLLNDARPFLIQIYRNALAHEELRHAGSVGLMPGLVRAGLTEREAEVVSLVASGGSNRDIGARLGISGRTVQKHLERGFRKLGVATRSAAAARAWELASEPDGSSS